MAVFFFSFIFCSAGTGRAARRRTLRVRYNLSFSAKRFSGVWRDTVRSCPLPTAFGGARYLARAPDSAVCKVPLQLLRRTLERSHPVFPAPQKKEAVFWLRRDTLRRRFFDHLRWCPKNPAVLETPQSARLRRAAASTNSTSSHSPSPPNKKEIRMYLFFWRRRRDSNSRTSFPAYSLSRGAPSTYLGTSPYIKFSVPSILQGRPMKATGHWWRCFAGDGMWRRRWDSNPRLFRVTGFQDQLLKPLGHLSLHETKVL